MYSLYFEKIRGKKVKTGLHTWQYILVLIKKNHNKQGELT
ncbi:MAG: hypothetical protein GY749_01360 [Desulfobacteraceae bacterium]|nr:hypothetical protein [Desulfobacteraceae bacterium]